MMVETKSVKVDNWGVFFLQKLQNFFNKTDYCDLTLQFNDNCQLKVHRLVLSACTDYFNVLEQHGDMTEDILVMPPDLQADVVVPIVNFMYTGTLEFEVNMYTRLLKTARDMNMTVLLKLLEAHKRTVEIIPKERPMPVLLNKGAGGGQQRMNTYSRTTAQPVAAARTYTPRKTAPVAVAQKIKVEKPDIKLLRQQSAISYIRKNLPEPVQLVAKYANTSAATQRGPSRFEVSDEIVTNDTFESSFDNISYESRPLITASQIKKEERDLDSDSHTSGSFEQLRKSYTGSNKRPASSLSFGGSPPEKKPNIQDVKEYTEAHRQRKAIVAAEEFDEEYVDDIYGGGTMDDCDSPASAASNNRDTSTMVIKNDASGNVNHAKIISEVLKKYPHLVKNNKNIKLKIMQKGGGSTATITSPSSGGAAAAAGPIIIKQEKGSPQIVQQPATSKAKPAAPQPSSSQSPAFVAPNPAPKKIDSKTMHMLIGLGAENMTGPWLCLKCGVNGRPISIPSYKGFRRHLINVHKEKIDHRLCEHCGWRSSKLKELYHHAFVTHNISPPAHVTLPKCHECGYVAMENSDLKKHKDEFHPKNQNKYTNAHHCIYCNKTFSNEVLVYDHIRQNHKERACEDGVMDFDDDDEDEQQLDDSDKYVPNNEMGTIVGSGSGSSSTNNKIKVLSNITLPSKGISYVLDTTSASVSTIGGHTTIQSRNINLEPSSEAEALSNVASGIATSLGVIGHPDAAEEEEYLKDNNSADDMEEHHSADSSILPNHYIEEAMASVHGEFLTTKDSAAGAEEHHDDDDEEHEVTQFVTEEGSTLELSESQKAELLQQLQDRRGVVMILNDESFEQEQEAVETTAEAASTSDQGSIVVVYSTAGGTCPPETTKSKQVTTVAKTTLSTATTTSIDSANLLHDEEHSMDWQEATGDNNSQSSTNEKDVKNEEKEEDDDGEHRNDEEDEDHNKTDDTHNESDKKEEDEEEDDDEDDKENAAKTSQKKKSIAKELIEDDWSDDELLDTPAAADKSLDEKQKNDKEKKEKTTTQSKTDKKSDKDESEKKKLTSLIDDWNEEEELATIGGRNDDDDEEEEEAKNTVEDKQPKKVVESSNKNDEDEEQVADKKKDDEKKDTTTTKAVKASSSSSSSTVSSKTVEKKTVSKNEIKKLINDWGDDDEDEEDYQ